MTKAILYIVATPIGNLEDITARALRILQEVDLIAAEDTRHSKKLLQHYGIQTALTSLHEHNEKNQITKLLELLKSGKAVALISDAGTPLISDPGYHLVLAARQQNISVVPIPGPSALIAALSVAGLPSDRFIFEGFLPAKANQRRERLKELQNETRTLIFYEAPHRILTMLADLQEIFGAEREATVARELTKTYETVNSGTLKELYSTFENNPEQIRGEFVVIVHGAQEKQNTLEDQEALRILNILLEELPTKQAASLAAKITGVAKNTLYTLALEKKQQ